MNLVKVISRTYQFGTVTVDVFPELVTIAVPYDGGHGDFADASLFIERYTHAVSGTVVEDDDLRLELHVYPNTDQLISGRAELPLIDPRMGEWDEPAVAADDRRSLLARWVEAIPGAAWHVQDTAVRTAAAVLALV